MTEFTDGTAKFKVTKSCGILPGTVTAFSGTFEDGYPVDKNTGLVNREWHLCDGTNGTPDLRNRFIYGGDGTNNGATGGEANHKLTEAELPVVDGAWNTAVVLNHGLVGVVGHAYGAFGFDNNKTYFVAEERNDGSSYGYGYKFGGNQPHNNMPPYYVLAYIMKL
ncbi:MAG: hypothetical protein LKE88_05025 [Acidaminococcus provencensis]|uniref:hypothetical protein n=1 Tax=Acidaminococcus provencensis TaxID=2058289 RepID=UPI0023F3290E|nr:hypothetical protein [Acidaminococcus provencensis]MCH4095988.1 hypothetical protein [Acidaminococcus provencensis]